MAAEKLNRNIKRMGSTHETLNHSDALNFLAMAGIFDEYNVGALATITHGGLLLSKEELQIAMEQIIDSSIEFILKYPDLEYTENTTYMNMLSLYKTCRFNFIERVLLTHLAAVKANQDQRLLSPSNKMTPRITNKAKSDFVEMA